MGTTIQLTKKQRHEAYKSALEKFRGEFEDGICTALLLVTPGLDVWQHLDSVSELFPELWAKNPGCGKREYWFSFGMKGHAQRIEVLKACIEETAVKTIA